MPSRYDILNRGDDNSSSSESISRDKAKPMLQNDSTHKLIHTGNTVIPSFEDLSMIRNDEEIVLAAIYGDDYTKITNTSSFLNNDKKGKNKSTTSSIKSVWGLPTYSIHVRPPDTNTEKIGSELSLVVQLNKNYPYIPPTIQLTDIKGLTASEQAEILKSLNQRAISLSQVGSVMVCELVQIVEDYLYKFNKDPIKSKMSAWEIMKAKEEEEKKKLAEYEKKMHSFLNIESNSHNDANENYDHRHSNDGDEGDSSNTDNDEKGGNERIFSMSTNIKTLQNNTKGKSKQNFSSDVNVDDDKIQREITRQRQALDMATKGLRRMRQSSLGAIPSDKSDIGSGDIEGDSYLINYDDDEEELHLNFDIADHLGSNRGLAVNSRYQSDFIELGLLGRGGGGEVVKVKNRLDRRIYAIKKVLLESESGRGKIHNSKLRREVTTISRMTHKNIVRYYQAWVEGGSPEEVNYEVEIEDNISAHENIPKTRAISDDPMKKVDGSVSIHFLSSNDSEQSKSDTTSSKGWWKSNHDGEDERNSSSWSDSDIDDDEVGKSMNHQKDSQDIDEDINFAMQSPLLTGFGFQNKSYTEFVNKKRNNSIGSSSSLDDDTIDSALIGDSPRRSIQVASQRVLYIQMEYCHKTLRHMIDDESLSKMEVTKIWKLIRQTIEALDYIHKRRVIHRDLKPGNIFLDTEDNVRLGDFGLATTRLKATDQYVKDDETSISEAQKLYDAIDDISDLLGGSQHVISNASLSKTRESITGGVGTALYCAPEQEGLHFTRNRTGKHDYDMKADIFSLGIIIFEMFHPPFSTGMERVETLSRLRGDRETRKLSSINRGETSSKTIDSNDSKNTKDNAFGSLSTQEWTTLAQSRFPSAFLKSTTETCQKLILWCLQYFPDERPTAKELLASSLIPRKIELEEQYLNEALQLLANPESESHQRILDSLFDRNVPQHVEITFDTDLALKADTLQVEGRSVKHKKRLLSPLESLSKALHDIGGIELGVTRASKMSSISMLAFVSALNRAKDSSTLGKLGKESLRGVPSKAAVALASTAATIAASSQLADGVIGADPRLLNQICVQLTNIFESHGAVELRPPLLRPRDCVDSSKHGGPAEIMNKRGVILLLPEDHTASFARAIGRSGGSVSNIKRFIVDKVFHKSLSGGHPRETLEASFDIVLEGSTSKATCSEAEVLVVVCQVMASLIPRLGNQLQSQKPNRSSPLWFIRLTHTRLTDSILDICGIIKESTRKACLYILSRFGTCPLSTFLQSNQKNTKNDDINKVLDTAIDQHGLSIEAASKLKIFFGYLPLPSNIFDALVVLEEAVKKLREVDEEKQTIRRRKKYEDLGRSLYDLRQLFIILESLGVSPRHGATPFFSPSFIVIDLGLRQRRNHFQGQLFFQAAILHDCSSDDATTSSDFDSLFLMGRAVKLAEGGRYDDLVKKFRPPGNLGHYTAAPFPMCTGVRFLIGRILEHLYMDAAIASNEIANLMSKGPVNIPSLEMIRKSLGYPFPALHTVKCLIVSPNGMDTNTISDRVQVASCLWGEGISCEYVAQTGVLMSLIEAEPYYSGSESSGWNLDQLCGICSILKIPFVVIVLPHLLREKKSVRLRQVLLDVSTQELGINEDFIPLSSLPTIIKERLHTFYNHPQKAHDLEHLESNISMEKHIPSSSTNSQRDVNTVSRSSNLPDIEYMYIDTEQFYIHPEKMLGRDSKLKSKLKTLKSCSQRVEAFFNDLLWKPSSKSSRITTQILFTELPFLLLREYGTVVMSSNKSSDAKVSDGDNMTDLHLFPEKYPKYKKILKNLNAGLDYIIRENNNDGSVEVAHSSRNRINGMEMFTIFLYSIPDDRFDMVTIEYKKDKNGRR